MKLLKKTWNKNLAYVFAYDLAFYVLLYTGLMVYRYGMDMLMNLLTSLNLNFDFSSVTGSEVEKQLAIAQGFQTKFVVFTILLIMFVYLLYSTIKYLVWSKLTNKKLNIRRYLRFLLVSLVVIIYIPLIIAAGIGLSIIFNQMLKHLTSTGVFPIIAFAVSLIIIALVIMPVFIYIVNFINVMYFYLLKGKGFFKKTFKVQKKLYMPYLTMSIVFILLTLFSFIFNMLPRMAELIAASILILLYLSWCKVYLKEVLA